ncbi:M20/M25/M40 family metallo-hydrolase [Cerasicoccus arenae]|uniref:Hydrolase n=1 Tax=Cerasicoccus arenae TaxID=424488 RepID=A0A8J3DE25_9BACT|nr:M20/M25/M40 family metallo-hydrolase [Cerasicoccus arenae]MBK1856911.1 M20/M25/M40 family metallo-hydrolase [Cerasicoccus arenae]GHB89804.1 hydrolase [Cerasicoccus arenae]
MPKKKAKSVKKANSFTPPEFLVDLLTARSPSGYETEAQAVLEKHVAPVADSFEKDALGNRYATINEGGDPVLMLAGHMDELGLMVKYIDDNGFVYFDTIGGHDPIMISGRRVIIMTAKGDVKGVTGKRAIHLMTPEDRKKVPEFHDLWIDIGAKSRDEALKRIAIGDPAVYDMAFELLHGTVGTARAFDDKAGCYVINETLLRLAKSKKKLAAKVVAVSTTQEEIGTRGATTSTYQVNPHLGIAVDVGHATDHPDCDPRKHGRQVQGGGPIIGRGPNINPFIFERLIEVAVKNNIPHQVESEPRPTPTDARAIQMARGGVAASIISIPLRYMHTPSEVVDLMDIEHTVQLLVAFAESLKPGEHGIW